MVAYSFADYIAYMSCFWLFDINLIKSNHPESLLITIANTLQRRKSTKWKGAIADIQTSMKNVLQYSARATGVCFGFAF